MFIFVALLAILPSIDLVPTSEQTRGAALIAAAVGQTAFVILYAFFPWWANFVGRALFVKGVSLAALLDLGLLARVQHWPYEDAVFTALYLLMAIGVWSQFIAFLRVRLASGRKREEGVVS